ncbi:MAG: hypothetical protein AAF628_37075 [Planctomycetota bacterium]
MSTATASGDTANQVIDEVLAAIRSGVAEALGMLVGKGLTAQGGDLQVGDRASLLGGLQEQQAVAVGAFDKDYAGQLIRFLVTARDATTLSGHLMMHPDEIIEEHRGAGTLEGEALETYAEVVNVLCSGVDGILRERFGDKIVLRAKEHAVLDPKAPDNDVVADGPYVGYWFELGIANYPPGRALILLEPSTAEQWNGGPITAASDCAHGVPEIPIRGRMAAFLVDGDCVGTVRDACRRSGLELDRHPKTAIPNPAAHVGDVVLLEVPPGDTKRFDWCRRLKAFDAKYRVVLILRHPTRSNVTQGFMANADMIVGLPLTDVELAQRLEPLLGAPATEQATD